MNELSIEQKAAAYDVAIEKLRNAFYNDKSRMCEEYRQAVIKVLEPIFPELKESEDEMIRKRLIRFVTNYMGDIGKEECLDWLEKQSEQKTITDFSDLKTWKYIVDAVLTEKEGIGQYLDSPFTEEVAKKLQTRFGNIEKKPKDHYAFNSIPRLLEMIEPTDKAKSYCQKLIDSLLQEGYVVDAEIVSNCLKQMNDEKIAMATMDEQDPNDIKPKFKVGDYVVGKYISGYITEIRDDCYLLGYQGFPIDKQDNYHLWTLQDAKDGNILVDGNFIVIFKENNYNPSDKSGCMCVYCSFDMNNDDFYTESGGYNPTYFYPATKVQRALLFQKMCEAGYEWDAERKELKRI